MILGFNGCTGLGCVIVRIVCVYSQGKTGVRFIKQPVLGIKKYHNKGIEWRKNYGIE